MLIEFSVGNYRSFKEVVTLSLVAANLKTEEEAVNIDNIFPVDNQFRLLKSAVIYGANASGKSNLIQALRFMKLFVLNSSRESVSADPIGTEPFRLSTDSENAPSFFEIIFFLDGKRYRYGFEADPTKIHAEWLYQADVEETMLFSRENGTFNLSGELKEGQGLPERTRNNALFLSVIDQWNGPIAQNILSWFEQIGFISGLDDTEYRQFTLSHLAQDSDLARAIVQFVREMDLDIFDLQIELSEVNLPQSMPQELRHLFFVEKYIVKTVHKKYDKALKQATLETFNFADHESEGTQKILSMAGPLLYTLQQGDILIIDEFDARLHPLITQTIIKLFNSSTTNPHQAQLIFATHDTNLLTNTLFRRDQIWFTEKSKYGVSDLYSLAEYNIRNDASFEKDYIAGKYGAIPFLGNIEHLVGEASE